MSSLREKFRRCVSLPLVRPAHQAQAARAVEFARQQVETWQKQAQLTGRSPVLLVGLLQHLGDVVMASVLVQALKEKYPQSTLIFATKPSYFPLLQYHPDVDHLVPVNCLGELLALSERCGLEQFYPLIFDGFACELCRSRWVESRPSLAGLTVDNWFRQGRHLLEYFFLMAGVEWGGGQQRLYLPPEQADRTKLLWSEAGLNRQHPVVCFHTQTPHWPAKQWSLDSFVELGHRLVDTWQAQLVLVGTEAVAWPTDGPPIHDLTRKLGLLESAGLLQSADLLIGLDSGPAHLATAVGTASVVVYGGTSPETCRPLGPQVTVVHLREPCNPCFINQMKDCLLPVPCIRRTPVQDVYRAAEAVLNLRAQTAIKSELC